MNEFTQLKLGDNEILYVLTNSSSGADANKKIECSEERLKETLVPIVKFSQMFRESLRQIAPDEMEFAMQLQVGFENGKLFWGLVNAKAEATVTVKYVWKNNKILGND